MLSNGLSLVSHIDLRLAGSIGEISNLILVNSYSKCCEVISENSAITDNVIGSLRQALPINWFQKSIYPELSSRSLLLNLKTIVVVLLSLRV
nr:hypothetical transcript [Hymenolepis microstoma]